MKQFSITHNTLLPLLQTRLSPSLFSAVTTIQKTDILPLVYTSFDGDHLSHSELMKQFVFKQKMIPLNPESALGTYLVTNHYQGKKYPIIEDCLKLLLLCDVFYIMTDFTPEGIQDFSRLPEGVIAEVLYWAQAKHKKVAIVDITTYQAPSEFVISEHTLDFLHPLQKDGIKKILATTEMELRKAAYLLSGEKHAKHTDWLRMDAYKNGMVPLSPYTLCNESSLQLAYPDTPAMRYAARACLGVKADEVRIYGIHSDETVELELLETDMLVELYLISALKGAEVQVTYTYFGDIGIPKYANKDAWAITEFEKQFHS